MLVAFVNGAGRTGKARLLGRTQVAAPFHGCLARLDHNRQGLLHVTVDTGVLATAEAAYRAREDYRTKGHRCASIRSGPAPLAGKQPIPRG
jgi:hypothetical protein